MGFKLRWGGRIRTVRDPKQTNTQQLLLIWEKGAKPDLLREIAAFTDEDQRTKLTAFLDRVESRIVAHVVMAAGAVDKKAEPKAPG